MDYSRTRIYFPDYLFLIILEIRMKVLGRNKMVVKK